MAEYIGREAAIAALTEFCYDQTASKYLSVDDCLVARDAIERATKVLESLPAPDVEPVQEWISVEDRLPEMGEHYQSEDVLVYIDYRPDDPDTTKDSYVSIDHVDFNCFGQGGFSCERDDPIDGEPSPYFVTHWMPMPNPPKGE